MSSTGESCAERTGFLFAHDCGRLAVDRCETCQKPICAEHRHTEGVRSLCTTCASKLPDAATRFSRSPYFMARRLYPDYRPFGLDFEPDDFTEADGESTRVEGDEAFERDLGAS